MRATPEHERRLGTQGKSLPILMAEDDEPAQKLLQALLLRFGYASEVAVDGGEASTRTHNTRRSIALSQDDDRYE